MLAGTVGHGFGALQGFDAVHFRHHMVQEHDVVVVLGNQLQTFLAGSGCMDMDAGFLQQAFCDGEVHVVVVHYQNMGLRGGEAFLIVFFFPQRRFNASVEIPDGVIFFYLLGNANGEGAAFAVNAVHADAALHHFRQLHGDGQPQSGAFDIAILLDIQPLEFGEEFFLVLLADANARVLRDEFKFQRIVFCRSL